jgi:maleamate amidohydrolase
MEWEKLLPESDLRVYEAAGYGGEFVLGKRPVLLVVDVTNDFAGDKPEPILESIKRFPNSSGEMAWQAIRGISQLLAAFRSQNLPIVYTKGPDYSEIEKMGNWLAKNTKMGNPPEDSKRIGSKIVKEIEPQPGEIVIIKDKPSGFFGTDLTSYLIKLAVDTVIVTGGTTSGCVRATVIDAFSYSFKVGVVTDGVFDRGTVSHLINLFDMHAKYANLMTSKEVTAYIQSLV